MSNTSPKKRQRSKFKSACGQDAGSLADKLKKLSREDLILAGILAGFVAVLFIGSAMDDSFSERTKKPGIN